jgi:Fe-Mn family superoxide dismutase
MSEAFCFMCKGSITAINMKYTQPILPYAVDALAPIISEATVNYHYGKHAKGYIDNLNKLIDGTEFEDDELEDIICRASGTLYNNAAQAWNHIFYFFSLSPDGGGEPGGELAHAINIEFGSFDKFKTAFVEAGANIFGSGWVWLSRNEHGRLVITQEANAGNPLTSNLTPILAFDVWEHAYYLDYQNRRADALNGLWNIVDWDVVESRY